jgi:hypothetical protein
MTGSIGPPSGFDGFQARLDNRPLAESPYHPADPEGTAWRQGWLQAEVDSRARDGRLSADSTAQRARLVVLALPARTRAVDALIASMARPEPEPPPPEPPPPHDAHAGPVLAAA